MRTGGNCRTVDREISRFPRKERLHMPGSLTTPGRPGLALSRPDMLPSTLCTASAPRMRLFSRLNGWPMRSPVNASPRPSRATAHDSGPMWFAIIVRDLHPLLLAGLPALRITRPLIPPIPDIRADIDLRRFGPLPTHALQKPRRDPTTGSHQ